MNVASFVYEINQLGFTIWLSDDQLRYAQYYPSDKKNEILEVLRNHKDAVIKFLKFNNIIEKGLPTPHHIYKTEDTIAPLSFSQERLWFIHNFEEGTSVYNISIAYELHKTIDIDLLKKALQSIMQRHSVLRSVIRTGSDGVEQHVISLEEQSVSITDVSLEDGASLDWSLQQDERHIFDLYQDYPILFKLYLCNEIYYLSLIVHHIAFDGWSIDIFVKELVEYYKHHEKKMYSQNLGELPIQYKDYALWQRKYLSGCVLAEQMNFWVTKLSGYQPLNLAYDKPRPLKINYCGENVYFEVNSAISENLRNLAKKLKVTVYSILLTTYYLLLRAYSFQDDIVIGTPMANRHHEQAEDLIGFFVNTLAIRINAPHLSLQELIVKIGSDIFEAQSYQDLPFEKLVQELKIPKDTSRHPIFQVFFSVQNFGDTCDNETEENFLIRNYSPNNTYNEAALFDLNLNIDDSKDVLKGYLNFAKSLFFRESIERMVKTYCYLLQQLSAIDPNSSDKIGSLQYIEPSNHEKVISIGYGEIKENFFSDKTIHELFEDQVKLGRHNIAIVYEDIEYTYQELNTKANKLAHYLREQYKIDGDDLVAICLPRSDHMMIGILGVLKAGAAYIPIDIDYPNERIQFMLTDTKAKAVLTYGPYKSKIERVIQSLNNNVIGLEVIDEDHLRGKLQSYSECNLTKHINKNNLAYVIYTSGTTGVPKGVLVQHSNVIRLFMATDHWYKFNERDVWILFHSYVFDFSVWEMWGALVNGARLIIPTRDSVKDLVLFAQLCAQHKVTVLNQTPKVFYQLSNIVLTQKIKLNQLRYIIFGGDILNTAQLRPWVAHFGYTNPQLINMYGITETTVHVTYKAIAENDIKEYSNIGIPIPDQSMYVLNKDLCQVPVGAIGELYVGGAGLARGYLNQPELMKARFLPNKFRTKKQEIENINEKIYKTGDLGLCLSDGSFQYIGRNDLQVKIRGYRIELSEIETAISNFPGVKQAVVIVQAPQQAFENKSIHDYLVGYYVSDKEISEHLILGHLSKKLPQYMLPTTLVFLDKLPITINGKLDIQALPYPNLAKIDKYVAPRNELEQQICHIWAEILNINADIIGIKSDFFDLGGNSLLSISLINRLNIAYQARLKVADIFSCKTIETLLPKLFQTKNAYQNIVRLNNSEEKQPLFMIHPGGGGCEVYSDLAKLLSDDFVCYGIDSYNLYNEEKIVDIKVLAKYYLSLLMPIISSNNQDEYHLLGWSLGGQISLEIAVLLEEMSAQKIKVYLLDTILYDDTLLSFFNSTDDEKQKKEYEVYALSKGYEPSYIQKVVATIALENKFFREKPSYVLQKTDIVLFKAIEQDIRFNDDDSKVFHEYTSTLSHNNVDRVVANTSQITLIPLNGTHHGNILEQEKLISRQLQLYRE